MSTRIKDKAAARKAAHAARIAALLLAAVGGAVAFAGIPGLAVRDIEPAPPTPVGTTNPNKPAAEDAPPPPDVYGIADTLSYIGNVPEPETVVVEDTNDEPVEDTGGGLTEREIRFVGSITSGGRDAAFLNIAGVTKVLRPGEVYEGVRLVEVVGDEIAVSINGGEEEMIGKSERKGSAVSVVTGGAPAPASTAVAGDEPRIDASDMSREQRRAEMLERARSERARWQRDRGERNGPPN